MQLRPAVSPTHHIASSASSQSHVASRQSPVASPSTSHRSPVEYHRCQHTHENAYVCTRGG